MVTTDGKTLLGADDKAGVAEIWQWRNIFLDNPQIKHPDIYIAFTPDGKSAEEWTTLTLSVSVQNMLNSRGGGLVNSNMKFNAASAVIELTGQSVHPGRQKTRWSTHHVLQ